MTEVETQASRSPPTGPSREPRTAASGATSRILLRAVLVVGGAFTVFTGLNRALGGMRTLGWQGSTDFLRVLSEYEYLIQDSHTRFLGGVWAGVGVLLLISPLNLRAFQPVLNVVFAIIFVGGLARFSMMRPDIVFGADIIGSLAAELLLMPLLFVWLSRAIKQTDA